MSDKPEQQKLIIDINSEVKLEVPPFSHFPNFRIIGVIKDGKEISTEYWPTNTSMPSTKHRETIRLLNLGWNGVKVKAEYDSTSKMIKVFDGNVDSIILRVSY